MIPINLRYRSFRLKFSQILREKFLNFLVLPTPLYGRALLQNYRTWFQCAYLSNERARARDKKEKSDGEEREEMRARRGYNVRRNLRKTDALYTCTYIHACKTHTRTTRTSPHTFHCAHIRAYACGPVCIGSKNWSKKDRKRQRMRRGGRISTRRTENCVLKEDRESEREKVRIYRGGERMNRLSCRDESRERRGR